MTEIRVPAGETGVTRVFHVDLPADAVARFTGQAGTGEWPLQYALGADTLREDVVEVVAIRDLGGMPLSTYLAEAYDVEGSDFARDRAKLDALTGHVVVIPARAFEHRAQTLNVRSPLAHIGTYGGPPRSAPAAPLHSRAAEGSGSDNVNAETPPKTSPLLRALAIVVLALLAGVVLFLIFGSST